MSEKLGSIPGGTTPSQTGVTPAHSDLPTFPSDVLARLEELLGQVGIPHVALILWKRMSETEREMLGGNPRDAFENHGGTIGIWMTLHKKCSQPRAIIQIAREVDLITGGEFAWLEREISNVDPVSEHDDPDEKVQEAVQTRRLVVVRGPATSAVFWDRKLLQVRWGRKPKIFEFLWQLAQKACIRKQVCWDEVDRNSEKTIVHHRSRLKGIIPAELDVLIHVGATRHSYKLELRPEEVCAIQLEAEEWLLPPDYSPSV